MQKVALLCLLGLYSVASWHIVDQAQSGLLERTWPGVGAVAGGFLQFGGTHDDFNTNIYTFYNDLYYYSAILNTYVQLHPFGDLPAPRAFSSGVSDGLDCMWIYGGSQYPPALFPVTVYGDLWQYCLTDNEWVELTPRNQGPGARTGSSLVMHGNLIYLFGGLDASFQGHNDIWSYNIRTNKWALISPANMTAPQPIGQHLAVFQMYQGNLYAGYGERGLENGFGFATGLWRFNLATASWTLLAPMPDLSPTRNYLANVIFNGHIIGLGGDTPSSDPPCCGAPFPQNPTNQTCVYSIHDNSWSIVNSPLPGVLNLKRHRLVLVGDEMYGIGGWSWTRFVGQTWNPNVYTANAFDIIAQA